MGSIPNGRIDWIEVVANDELPRIKLGMLQSTLINATINFIAADISASTVLLGGLIVECLLFD